MKYKKNRLVRTQIFLDEDFVKKSKKEAKKANLSFSAYLRILIEGRLAPPLPEFVEDKSGNGHHLTLNETTGE